jgi:hypothetical protein
MDEIDRLCEINDERGVNTIRMGMIAGQIEIAATTLRAIKKKVRLCDADIINFPDSETIQQ